MVRRKKRFSSNSRLEAPMPRSLAHQSDARDPKDAVACREPSLLTDPSVLFALGFLVLPMVKVGGSPLHA